MSGIFLRYVKPTENWARTGSLSASSEATGYPATKGANDDPAWPWWGTSGSGSLTATFTAAEVGVVALIQTNTDIGNIISVTGSLSASLTGAQGAGGYPKNLAVIQDPGVTGSSITVSASGNSINWAVGELVVGKLRSMAFPISPGAKRLRTRSVIDDTDQNFDHTIRYDLGAEQWSLQGRTFADDAALADLIAWWESTKGGVLPTLIIPSTVDTEPRLVRMEMKFQHTNDGSNQHQVDLNLIEVARGILVA